mmetsp:Transcript_8626/g.18558  ORF Transcript_8626/g.18558 Transcript_8626/m.18558 type:complete len:248 (+) Transcript_8626:184-927(+)
MYKDVEIAKGISSHRGSPRSQVTAKALLPAIPAVHPCHRLHHHSDRILHRSRVVNSNRIRSARHIDDRRERPRLPVIIVNLRQLLNVRAGPPQFHLRVHWQPVARDGHLHGLHGIIEGKRPQRPSLHRLPSRHGGGGRTGEAVQVAFREVRALTPRQSTGPEAARRAGHLGSAEGATHHGRLRSHATHASVDGKLHRARVAHADGVPSPSLGVVRQYIHWPHSPILAVHFDFSGRIVRPVPELHFHI